jgi:ribosomal protein S18 acetylase RimI-like enzyme
MIKELLRRLPYWGPLRLARARLKSAIEVTEAQPEDMVNIFNDLTPNTPGVYFDNQSYTSNYIAVRKQKILGVVQLVRYPEGQGPFAGHWLMGLYVWPLYRGLGIGRLLSQRVMEQARDEGVSALHLLVWNENRPAIALYRRLNFKEAVIPTLEDELAREFQQLGRRRIVFKLELPRP